ncbi:MAG: metallophosphoesterase [Thermodesulfobacteriota bacterium]
MPGKPTGKTLALVILNFTLLALLAVLPASATGAKLYYGPWLIPANNSATEMFILVVTDKGVDDDFNHRRIHFTYDSDCPEPNWSYSHINIPTKLHRDRRLWKIQVTNLKPGRTYGYTFSYRTWSVDDWSSVAGTFYATKDASPDNEVLEFIGLGDNKPCNDENIHNSEIVAYAVSKVNKGRTFLVHTGDISYWGGQKLSEGLSDFWGGFLGNSWWQGILKRLPILTALGNHDFDTSTAATDTENYRNYFPFPNAGHGVGDQYYFYVNGPALFLSVDTFPMDGYCGDCDNLKPESSQYKWLENTLEQFDTDPRQWKIVLMHAPMYSPGGCNQKQAREYLEPLFEEHGVDLVLTGHEHYYCRKTVPTTAPQARNASTTHLILGGAGGGLSSWHQEQEKYFDKVVEAHHYAHFKIDKDVLEVTVIQPILHNSIASDWWNYVELDTIDHFYVDRTPSANFSYDQPWHVFGKIWTDFYDQSRGHRYQYHWDFGDGNTSTAREPSHIYAHAGTYNVTLTIKSMWNQSSITRPVKVTIPWVPPFLHHLLLTDK